MDSILSLLHHEPQVVVDRCDKIVTHGVDNYLQFLALRYTKPLRKKILDILSVAQIKDIAGDTAPRIANRLIRPALFELCVFTEVSKRLQSGDLYIDHSIKYDDYRNHLVSDEVLRANLNQFCIESDLPSSSIEFSTAMKKALVARAAAS